MKTRLFLVAPLSLLVVSLPLSAAPSSIDRTVEVTGECFRKITADRAAVRITAESTSKDLKEAVKSATRAYEKVREGVRKLDLEALELETAEYSVHELREWEKDRSVSKGFKARMGLDVSTRSLAKVGEVLALAAREEIRDVGSLRSYVSREKIQTEKTACLEQAAQDARNQAEKLVTSLGAKLGAVLTLQEGDTPLSPPPFRPLMALSKSHANRAMMEEDSPAPPQIEAAQEEIRVRVQARFEIRP